MVEEKKKEDKKEDQPKVQPKVDEPGVHNGPRDQKKETKDNRQETANPPVGGGDARWYIIHTSSGHEQKVVAALRQRVESFGMQNLIQEVLIPTQEKIIISDGKKKTVRERLFPGYVVLKMVLTNETWAVVRNTTGVTGFVGAGAKPTPLSQNEIDAILQFTKMRAPKMEVSFKEGETVKIIDGPFADFLGKVEEIDEDKGKVQVLVSIFGRETPVELDFLQVSRL